MHRYLCTFDYCRTLEKQLEWREQVSWRGGKSEPNHTVQHQYITQEITGEVFASSLAPHALMPPQGEAPGDKPPLRALRLATWTHQEQHRLKFPPLPLGI